VLEASSFPVDDASSSIDPEDARAAAHLGAESIIVSNHGARQLDGVLSSIRALPPIVDG